MLNNHKPEYVQQARLWCVCRFNVADSQWRYNPHANALQTWCGKPSRSGSCTGHQWTQRLKRPFV